MAYKLTLTAQDWKTIEFVGYRYNWSDALMRICTHFIGECPEGTALTCEGVDTSTHVFTLPEHKAWDLQEAFERDTEGGHSMFPMLDGRSELAAKLYAFVDSIV